MKIVKENINEAIQINGQKFDNYLFGNERVLISENGILGKDGLISWNTFKKIYILGKNKNYF